MIKIGTNFLYKGVLFLDDRQGLARSKDDLKNWSIPVPEGFEVYLPLVDDSAWYTYKSTYISDETGHFERRLDKSYVDNRITEIQNELSEIWVQIWLLWDAIGDYSVPTRVTLEATFNPRDGGNGGYYWLPGNSKTPSLTWRILETNTLTDASTQVPWNEIESAKINGSDIPITGSWTASEPISSTTSYTLSVVYKGKTYTKSATYHFEPYAWRKIAGTSALPEISDISQLQDVNETHGWSSGSVAFEYNFNCDYPGGRYPYYIFPKRFYNQNTFRMIVGGFGFTDYDVLDLTIDGQEYKAVRTGIIQTLPILNIKYE